jgi:hypothetical protein
MKIIITESQHEFIRRFKVLDGLVSAAIELVSSHDDDDNDLDYYSGRLYGVDNNQ